MGIEKRRSTRTKINSYDTYKGIGDCDYDYYERTRTSKKEKNEQISMFKRIELFFKNFFISSKNKILNPFFKDNPVPLSCSNCRHNKWSEYRMKHYCESIGKNSHNLSNEKECNYGWIHKEQENICDNHELKYSCKNCLHKEFNEQIDKHYCKIGNYSNGLLSGEK